MSDSTAHTHPNHYSPDRLPQNSIAPIIRDLLVSLGEDPQREGLQGTPERVSRSWKELLAGYHSDPASELDTVFHIDHDDLILVRDIEFYSLCEHHLLPFYGSAHVAYIPQHGKVTGLSKIARVVEGYARRLQVQERLTSQIARAIEEYLDPAGVAVIIEATHMCMKMRGIQKSQSQTITSTLRGIFRSDPRSRAEILSLIQPRGKSR